MAARCKFSFGKISVAKWLTERKDRLVCVISVISILYHFIAVVHFIDLLVYLSGIDSEQVFTGFEEIFHT